MERVLSLFNPWWEGAFKTHWISRRDYLDRLAAKGKTDAIVFITGLRRVGKTTLVHQFIERLISGGTEPSRILYFSMDHPALVKESILDILDAFRRIQGFGHSEDFTAFIDEVHAREGFERELKAVHDMGHVKVYATGSSSIFMVEKGAYLTGRQTFIEVLPFSFQEYLNLKGLQTKKSDSHLMVRRAEEYVLEGGLPEYIRTGDPGYITTLLDAFLYRDVAARHGVRNVQALRELMLLVVQSAGSRISPRKLSNVLGLSHETVREYLSFFMEASLLHQVRMSGKLSESVASPRKAYLADTGLVHVISPTINLGCLVENAVFNELRTAGEVRYAMVNGKEVDFVRGDECYEVKYMDRVPPDAVSHLKQLKVGRRTVITRNHSGKADGIDYVPLWRFLLER